MPYLRFTVDVEVEEKPSMNEINEIESDLEGVIDNEFSAWVEYSHYIDED